MQKIVEGFTSFKVTGFGQVKGHGVIRPYRARIIREVPEQDENILSYKANYKATYKATYKGEGSLSPCLAGV